MPSQMTMSSKKDAQGEGRPIAFTVLGMNIHPLTHEIIAQDRLSFVNSTVFLHNIDKEIVSLQPRQLYNTIQIQFHRSSNATLLRLHNLAFMTCQESMCPPIGSLPSVRVGTSLPYSCPKGTVGRGACVCDRKDVQPHWYQDNSMCIPEAPD